MQQELGVRSNALCSSTSWTPLNACMHGWVGSFIILILIVLCLLREGGGQYLWEEGKFTKTDWRFYERTQARMLNKTNGKGLKFSSFFLPFLLLSLKLVSHFIFLSFSALSSTSPAPSKPNEPYFADAHISFCLLFKFHNQPTYHVIYHHSPTFICSLLYNNPKTGSSNIGLLAWCAYRFARIPSIIQQQPLRLSPLKFLLNYFVFGMWLLFIESRSLGYRWG